MGRVQLVDWIFQVKFDYLVQSSIVPREALETIQSITYMFIWGAQKEVAWRSMIKTKKQGEMGVRDFKTTQLAAIVQRACRMWEGEGIWSSWMGKRYIKEQVIQSIEQRQGDSAIWKVTLRHREQIEKCATLGSQNTKLWIGKGVGNSVKNAITTITSEYPKDDLAKDIWANKIGKAALNLWRVRRRNLSTKDRLIRRGMRIDGECTLCDQEQESIDHLFFKCEFFKWILKKAMEASGALVKTEGIGSYNVLPTWRHRDEKKSPEGAGGWKRISLGNQ